MGTTALPTRRRRRWWLPLLSLAVFAATLEGGARLALLATDGADFAQVQRGIARAGGGAEQTDLDALHPYLGYLKRGAPDADGGFVALNGNALYEPDGPVMRPDGDTLRVGISGGSVAGSFWSRRAGPAVLEAELRRDPRFADKRFVFVRLGYSGYKQPQQLVALSYLLSIGGGLDLLVNLDGFNEVALYWQGNERQGVYPAYPRAWVLRHPEAGRQVKELTEAVGEVRRRRVELARGALASPLRHLALYQLVWRARDGRLARLGARRGAEVRGLRSELERRDRFDTAGPQVDLGGREGVLRELVAVWERSSVQMAALCRANGIEYFHCLQPNQYVDGSKPLSAEEREKAYDVDHPYYPGAHDGYPLLRARAEALERAGVRFLDLTGVFAEVERTIYIDDCCHVNEAGDELMAAAIARFVLATLD